MEWLKFHSVTVYAFGVFRIVKNPLSRNHEKEIEKFRVFVIGFIFWFLTRLLGFLAPGILFYR